MPGWATTFRVPRHIVRIDIDDPGKAGTHGWQVRYRRPWRFFGDTVNRTRRSPAAALAEAIDFLVGIYEGPRNLLRNTPTRRKQNPIQEAGLRLVVRRKATRNMTEYYVEAVPPARSRNPRRFYVGTERTLTAERLEAAMEKARQARREMVDEHLRSQGITRR